MSADDLRMIRAFLFGAVRTHTHIDWIDPLTYLERSDGYLLLENNQLQALCIMPEDPEGIRWCRGFYQAPQISHAEIWKVFWKKYLSQNPDREVLKCVMGPNNEFVQGLLEFGFNKCSEVIYLRRELSNSEANTEKDTHIELLEPNESDLVWAIDQQCFEPIWRFPRESIEKGLNVPGVNTKIVESGQMIGYQISNFNYDHLHLARLAVVPGQRRKGYARRLINDLIQKAIENNFFDLSVNTQSDNFESLELYRQMGFEMRDHKIAIYCY